MILELVISGGQTGADQAGLRAAKCAGIATGGWMPRGFLTEDGRHPEFAAMYGIKEAFIASYSDRTRLNAQWGDVTLWFGNPETPGGRLIRKVCSTPRLIIWPGQEKYDWPADRIAAWLVEPTIMCKTLNISGNRESKNPGIGAWVEEYLMEVFRILKEG